MLFSYKIDNGNLRENAVEDLGPESLWIDLLHPALGEEKRVEEALGIGVPTREEMREIEASSRLYVENEARYMTASLLCRADLDMPQLAAVTFIVTKGRLITVRYDTPRSIDVFKIHSQRGNGIANSGEGVLLGITDSIIDRMADILERVTEEMDMMSSSVFANRAGKQSRADALEKVLQELGSKAELIGKSRESMVSLGRLLTFLATEHETVTVSKASRALIKTQVRDAESLTQHCDALANKVTFLLDAVLGLVGIEQNNIVKLFAVLSVVLMPPTLVASIYGMNFKQMPELEWAHGYPMALIIMLVVAVGPYVYFRLKRWL